MKSAELIKKQVVHLEKINSHTLRNILLAALAISGFLLSIDMLGLGLNLLAGERVAPIIEATSNPFVGLFIGLLMTAILQSSSTTTSIAVAAVASGSISLSGALPIILGANIGTTITSTIVAFGYITKGNEFRKAVSAAMIHDMFNILGVIILFPLELNYHFLQDLSSELAVIMPTGSAAGTSTFWFGRLFDFIGNSVVSISGPVLLIILSILLLFGCIKLLSTQVYAQLVGERKQQFQNAVFKNTTRALGWGVLLTGIVQSSSLTSSLIVPLVATGKVQLKRAFHFIMGANIGTTITAILAALFRSEAAMSLAIAHFLFNVFAVLIFFAIPILGKLPLYLAEKLGYMMYRYRASAFAYITLAFFVIPFGLIYFSKEEPRVEPPKTEVKKKADT